MYVHNCRDGRDRHLRCAVPDSGNSALLGGCRPATRIDLSPNVLNQTALFLEPCEASSSRIFKKYRENEPREPLAAIDRSQNGSTGSAILAQCLAAANTRANMRHAR